MPVDKFGKLIFRSNPADRYAKPINRKPKRRRRSTGETVLFYGLLALMICLLFYALIRTVVTSYSATSTPKMLWYESYVHDGAGSTELDLVPVTGTWRFRWSCPVTNEAMSLYVRDGQGNLLLLRNVECTSRDHAGMATIMYTGQPSMEMSAVGSWTVSIEEPTQ